MAHRGVKDNRYPGPSYFSFRSVGKRERENFCSPMKFPMAVEKDIGYDENFDGERYKREPISG